jgi:hypothetical protein
VDLYRYLQ